MERKIGEIFKYNDEWYQCVIAHSCTHCDMNYGGKCPMPMRECQGIRSDGKTVIFKKLEKLGEPFTDNGKLYQRYEVFDTDRANARSGVSMYVPVGNEKFVCIEIKQTKEEMEENKPNLKPFDLEAAKQGKPVCTRDGRKARIVCFDAEGGKPLIVLSKIDGKEVILRYTEKGQSDYYHSPTPREDDLMILPEKKEGWVNICKDAKDDDRIVLGHIFESREDAVESAPNNDRYITIATVRIEWEE